ncbi:hypothetical protein MTO96_041487 [Rhipicephalus appendiculatus]
MSVPARSSSEWRRLTMIELPLAIKAVVARFAVCRSFTKRKNMLRHARNVHEVLVEVNKPMNCYGCGVGLSSLEKYVGHHIEEHKFATEYVQQPFHNNKGEYPCCFQ